MTSQLATCMVRLNGYLPLAEEARVPYEVPLTKDKLRHRRVVLFSL